MMWQRDNIMNYFVENTPYAAFTQDLDDDILIEENSIDLDEDFIPENDLEEDFPDFIDNDWSWLQ